MSDYIDWLGQKNKDGKTNKQILTDCSSIEAGNIAWQAAQPQWQPITGSNHDVMITGENVFVFRDGYPVVVACYQDKYWYLVTDSAKVELLKFTPSHYQKIKKPKTGE